MNNVASFFPYYSVPSPSGPDLTKPLTFTAKSASKVLLSSVGSPDAVNLQYSINGSNWIDYSFNSMIDLNLNDTVAFSGNNDHFSESTSKYYRFQMTGTIEADGNTQSLMNYSDVAPSCYYRLFSGCASLTKAPLLPATTLANYCYNLMFLKCTNLTSAPLLPATTLANYCYSGMFNGCSSLIKAPLLPATTLVRQCYYYMFKGCTNLSSINVAFTNWSGLDTYNWVSNVAPTGIFAKPDELGAEYGEDRIPTNWTVINK